MRRKLMSLMTAIMFCGLSVNAASVSSTELYDVTIGETTYPYVIQKQYETSNPDEEIVFDEEVDGRKLVDIQYETIDTILQKKTLEEKRDYKDLIAKDDSKIEKRITIDGNVYELQTVIWSEVPNMETVHYTVDYGYQTKEPTPDTTYEYTYTSPVMKEENTVSLPFVRLDKGTASWEEGFSATVTFHNLDGMYFKLGDHEFEYDENNLSLSENDYKELVKMLGYDTSLYRLTSISWSGEEYEDENGVLCRKAKAYGEQYAISYQAYYEDTVENGKIYKAHATYACEVEIPADEAAPTYVMKATAYYEDNSSVAPVIITIGIIVLVILVIGILFVLARKRKTNITTNS